MSWTDCPDIVSHTAETVNTLSSGAFPLLHTSSFKYSDAVLRTSRGAGWKLHNPVGPDTGLVDAEFKIHQSDCSVSSFFESPLLNFRRSSSYSENGWSESEILCSWRCFEIKTILEDKCCYTKFSRQREIRWERHEIGRGNVESLFFGFLLFLAVSSFSGNKGEDESEVVTPDPKHRHVVHWLELSISFLPTKYSPGRVLLRIHRRGFYGWNLIHFTGERPCGVTVYTATCTMSVSEELDKKYHEVKYWENSFCRWYSIYRTLRHQSWVVCTWIAGCLYLGKMN